MKKNIFLIFLLWGSLLFAQENPADTTKTKPWRNLSAIYGRSDDNTFGISYETGTIGEKVSYLLNVGYKETNLSVNNATQSGTGFGIDLGFRYYILKKSYFDKLYMEIQLLSYSRMKFSDPEYSGVYEYISPYPFNFAFGYKFKLGERLTIDPFVGYTIKVEIMSRGDVDNRSFDNFVGRAGLKMGYQF